MFQSPTAASDSLAAYHMHHGEERGKKANRWPVGDTTLRGLRLSRSHFDASKALESYDLSALCPDHAMGALAFRLQDQSSAGGWLVRTQSPLREPQTPKAT